MTPKLAFKEVKGDLFTSGDCLGHCISADKKLGKGIAKTFERKFRLRSRLHQMNTDVGEVAAVLVGGRWIFNLVTKKRFFHKPRLGDLEKCLRNLRDCIIRYNVGQLALPRLGCGLDKLDWRTVKQMISSIFYDCDIDITIFYL